MIRYKTIKTKYVREKIKGKSFRNLEFREYLDCLIMIENHLLRKGPIIDAVLLHYIKDDRKKHLRLNEDYQKILDELHPTWKKAHEVQRKKDEKIKKMWDEMKRREGEKKIMEKELKEWVKLGGRK